MGFRRRYAVGLALLVLGTVGACTGGDDPPATGAGTGASSGAGAGPGTGTDTVAPGTSSPSSTTTAPSTVGSVPEIPKAARAHTKAGAEAFVRFFMDQVSVAWVTPQTGLIRDLGLPDCLACASFEKTAAELVEKGQRYERRPSTVISATASSQGRGQRVHAVIQQHQVNIVNASGAIISTDSAKRFSGDVLLIWKGNRWWIYDMG